MNGMLVSENRGVETNILGQVLPSTPETPPGSDQAARSGEDGLESGLDRVDALALLRFGGRDRQQKLLAEVTRQEATHGVGLPASGLHQFAQRRSIGALQQIKHSGCLAASTSIRRLFGAFGGFANRVGLRGRLRLLRRNVRAFSGNTGLLAGFCLAGARPIESN